MRVDTVWYRLKVNRIWWLVVGIVAAAVAQLDMERRRDEAPEMV